MNFDLIQDFSLGAASPESRASPCITEYVASIQYENHLQQHQNQKLKESLADGSAGYSAIICDVDRSDLNVIIKPNIR